VVDVNAPLENGTPLAGENAPGLTVAVPVEKLASKLVLPPDAIEVADALKEVIDGALTTDITMLAEYPVGETEFAVIV
jgi:hypothetical protein